MHKVLFAKSCGVITLIKKIFQIVKNLGKAKSALILGALIAVFLIIQAASVFGDMFGLYPGHGQEVTVNIPENAGVMKIAGILKDEGVIRHPVIFRVYEKIGKSHVFQQGGHVLGKGQSYKNIIKKLTSAPELSVNETVTVLIPEGFEAWQIARKLDELGIADEEKFLKELEEGEFDFDFIKDIKRKENRLEGYLFPATYEFFVGESEHDIICRMLKAFEEKILPLYNEASTKYSLDEIITMASLVEREAANDSERGKVASVFYNRLKKDMFLGSCATVQYIIKERKDILSNADIKIESDYNTYINKGLPIGPIASPGEASVRAALYPESTDYLYFAAKSDGSENVFTKTNAEHLRVVNKLQNQN